jgi:hypothetical protein
MQLSFRQLQFCKLAELFRLGKRKNALPELDELKIVFRSRRPSSETTKHQPLAKRLVLHVFFYVIRQRLPQMPLSTL